MEVEFASLFTDIVVILLISVILLIVLYRVKIPSVIAFILAGIIVGPSCLGIVTNEQSIDLFAELGVIFLLFTIGLEYSISNILKSKRFVLIGGSVQVGLTIGIIVIATMAAGVPLNKACFWGMLVSLSSTAIVMKVLADRKEVESPYGKATLGILIFQDLIVIPMVMITPLLSGSDSSDISPVKLIGGGILLFVGVLLAAKYVIPPLLTYAVRLRNREMFLFIVLGTCLVVAYLTSEIGLSMALGAFLAGLIISESEYSSHAMYNVIPFRDLFASFFFISIGMIFDLSSLFSHFELIILAAFGIIFIKYLTGTIAALITRLPARGSVLTGFALSQVGEFSFILAATGYTAHLLTSTEYMIFLNVSVITMVISPLLLITSGRFIPSLSRPFEKICQPRGVDDIAEVHTKLKDHIIIVGYGLNGRNVAKSANIAGVPFRVIETNPDTVITERKAGIHIMYGDAVQEEVLIKAGIREARVLVVVVNDPFSIQQVVQVAREVNPLIYIIARTRFVGDVKNLLELGADEVIPEEFETSVEIFTRVLYKYLVPADEIERFVAEIRASGYQMLRTNVRSHSFEDLRILVPDIDLRMVRLTDQMSFSGQTLAETTMRNRFSVMVVAIRRGERTIVNPGGEEILYSGDVLMCLGKPQDISTAFATSSKGKI